MQCKKLQRTTNEKDLESNELIKNVETTEAQILALHFENADLESSNDQCQVEAIKIKKIFDRQRYVTARVNLQRVNSEMKEI